MSRFWDKVVKTPTCWNWTGYACPKGYGQFNQGTGKPRAAHRISKALSGVDVPKDMAIDHVCRNRRCVNPAHLRVVTYKQNTLENSVGPSAQNAAKTHCFRGHPLSPENVWRYTSPSGKVNRKCRKCCAIRGAEAYKRRKARGYYAK